jgi:hypothetical protein
MAKKAQSHAAAAATKKKRKAQSVAPKAESENVLLGTVSIVVQLQVTIPNSGPFNEMVIEWGCLGLSEEPDGVTETSGNNRLLDTKRPITTSEEGMHVYFDPPLSGSGAYGFQFLCTYNDAVEARTAKEEEDEPATDREAA